MPDLIKPSQLEKNLPEETDTVAKALLKYLKFTITFWRWFKGVIKSDGDFTDDFKQQLCGIGCAGRNVQPNEDEIGPDPGNNDKNPDTSPPPGGDIACCHDVPDKDNGSFTYFNVSGALTNENYIDLKCINNIRHAVVKNKGHDVHINSNGEFRDILDNMPTVVNESSYDESNQGTQIDLAGNRIYYPSHIGGGVDTTLMWNKWPHVEVLIWGQTPKLIDNAGMTNHHLLGSLTLCGVKKVNFLMKNNDYWMARVIVTDLRNALRGGRAGTDIEYFFSDFSLNLTVTNQGGLIVRDDDGRDQIDLKHDRHFPTGVKLGDKRIHQSVLTKIGGIRVSVFNQALAEGARLLQQDYLNGEYTPLPYGLGYSSNNGWNTCLTIFEERWLDESPEGCYEYPHNTHRFMGIRQLQFLWKNKNTDEMPFYPDSIQKWVASRGRIFFDNYRAEN